MKLLNAFSLSMLPEVTECSVQFTKLTLESAKAKLAQIESFVGHADTAAVLSSVLGLPVQMNRGNAKFAVGEKAVVAQYSGPRLPEGCKELPAGASFVFFEVQVG